MVKANCKIYPLPVISRSTFQKFSSNLKKLEKETNTSITYSFEERYFDINGVNKAACDEAELIICQSLLPRLNEAIETSFMLGTYEDLSMLKLSSEEISITRDSPKSTTDTTAISPVKAAKQLQGQPLLPKHEKEQEESPFEEYQMPREDVETEEGDIVNQTFTISPLVRNARDLLIGPPQHNMQLADYMNLISANTNTICSLDGRNIKITGTLEAVQLAYEKFAVIQKTYIGQSKTILVPCTHYPRETGYYGLYFCDLSSYRHKSFVHIQLSPKEKVSRLFVLLPVFPDPTTNEYAKPKDYITAANQASPQAALVSRPPPPQPQPQPSYTNSQLYSMDVASSSSVTLTDTETIVSQKQDRFVPTLWGLDRDFKMSYNTGNLDYLSSERLAKAFTPPPPLPLDRHIPMLQDFPTLEPTPTPVPQRSVDYKPTLSLNKPKARGVLRIVPQKSAPSPTTPRPSLSLMERVREYNYHNIKNGLSEGLESVRGFKGEIRLSAKLGKVLWTNIKPGANNRIWRFEDINDIVVREQGTYPRFSNITTNDADIMNCMDSIEIPDKQFLNRTAIFEFHCSARNQPQLEYKPIVLHMNQGVIDVRKVVICEKVVTEVDWTCLDRKYDFQMTLTTKQLVRRDVKPYTTFIKWVSICPITHLMSFENVPNFLHVNYIIFKQTTRYRIFPFIIEITRSEMVPMKPVANSQKINAHPGSGEAWYDFEVYNTLHDAPFKANLDLELGTEALWTVDDILQSNNSGADMIFDFVKCMLLLIEKIEAAITQSEL